MTKTKILPALTTFQSDWRAKISEIDELGLTEIALFPTVLDIKEREEYYELVAKTGVTSIPHIHIRDDFEKWELDHLSEKYGAKVFNTHANPNTLSLLERCEKYKQKIFIENTFIVDEMFFEQVEMCGGICIDFTHWKDGRFLKWRGYKEFDKRVGDYQVGCSHISAIHKFPVKTAKYGLLYNDHTAKSLDNLDYLKEYKEWLPEFASLELTNSFAFQIKAKKYIEDNIL